MFTAERHLFDFTVKLDLIGAVEEFPLWGFAAYVLVCVSTKPDTVSNREPLERTGS